MPARKASGKRAALEGLGEKAAEADLRERERRGDAFLILKCG